MCHSSVNSTVGCNQQSFSIHSSTFPAQAARLDLQGSANAQARPVGSIGVVLFLVTGKSGDLSSCQLIYIYTCVLLCCSLLARACQWCETNYNI